MPRHIDSTALTKRYPPAQLVTIIPMATDTLADPNTFPTTVGIVEKNPPFAIPLMITNTTNGPMDVETGQMISILRALSNSETNSVLSPPMVSLANPQVSLPKAEEKLNAATTPAPAAEPNPRESVYRGRKKGGTSSGNVAMAPAAKRSRKRMSRNRRLVSWESVQRDVFMRIWMPLPLNESRRGDRDSLLH